MEIAIGLISTVVSLFIGWWLGRRDTERTQAMLNAVTRVLEAHGTDVEFIRDKKGLATGALLHKRAMGGSIRPSGDLQAKVIRGPGASEPAP